MTRLLAVWCLLLVALLGGCWDYRDLDQRALLVMLGLDPGAEGGYRVTAQVAVGSPHGREAGRRPAYRVVSGEGPTIQEGLQAIRAQMYRELDLDLVGTVVIGAELAQQGLAPLDWLARSLDLPATAQVTVSRETAEAVLTAESPALAIPGQFAEWGLSGRFTRYPAAFPMPVWKLYYRLLPSPLEDEVLPALTSRLYGINFAGAAVFAGGQWRGWLAPEQAQLFGILRWERFIGQTLAGEVPGRSGSRAAARTEQGRVVRWVELRGGRPVLVIRLTVRSMLEEVSGFTLATRADQNLIEQGLARELEGQILALVRYFQELGADPFGFGELLRRQDPHHPLVRDPATWRAAFAGSRVLVETQVAVSVTTAGWIR